jgi:hypothetical protein
MATLALHHDQPPVSDPHVGESQVIPHIRQMLS